MSDKNLGGNRKSQNRFEIFDFPPRFFVGHFRKIFGWKNFHFFFELGKEIFFSELRKNVGYSFDVKFSDLSIYDVFGAFGARQI